MFLTKILPATQLLQRYDELLETQDLYLKGHVRTLNTANCVLGSPTVRRPSSSPYQVMLASCWSTGTFSVTLTLCTWSSLAALGTTGQPELIALWMLRRMVVQMEVLLFFFCHLVPCLQSRLWGLLRVEGLFARPLD